MIDGMRKPKRTWPRTSDKVTCALVDLETGELHGEFVHIKRCKPKLGEPVFGNVYTVVATYDELTGEWHSREVPGKIGI